MRGPPGVSRRTFLLAGGGAVATGLAAGCSGGSTSTPPAPTPTPTPTPTTAAGVVQPSGDLAVAVLAASLENTLAAAYGSLLDLGAADKLAALPPAISILVETIASQHRDHAAAWNAILTAAGDDAITRSDATVFTTVIEPALPTVRDVASLVDFALRIERIAAATYLGAVQQTLTTTGAIQTAAAIHPVEMQHIAILGMFTGSSPVPDSFATSSGARSTTDQLR